MFLEQLRAILRAAEHGPVRLLIPMLAHGHEVDQSMRLIAHARAQLADRLGRDMPPVPVGGMIEVPAAALTAPFFARRLDFLSIGTNDLVQYTLAIDRADHAVASLYDRSTLRCCSWSRRRSAPASAWASRSRSAARWPATSRRPGC